MKTAIQSNQPMHMEVCYFAARSIYDGFNDEEWNQPTLIFIQSFYQFMHQAP
jgi:hypothetical protein